jgi:hypothetical protein
MVALTGFGPVGVGNVLPAAWAWGARNAVNVMANAVVASFFMCAPLAGDARRYFDRRAAALSVNYCREFDSNIIELLTGVFGARYLRCTAAHYRKSVE